MFRTFLKVRHASVLADPYQLCYDSTTNTNPRQSIRCWSGGCCFISLCSAICGVSTISRKSAMSRPLVFCSSVALSSKMLLMTTLLQTDCSNGIFDFHLSVAPRSGNRMMSRPPNTLTAIWLRQPCIPPVASQMKLGMKCDAIMAVFSLSTIATDIVGCCASKCSPKKHWHKLKSGRRRKACAHPT